MTSPYDPFSSETLHDPAAGHRALARCPVHHFDRGEMSFYTLSGYDDIRDALMRTDIFSSRYGQGPKYFESGGMQTDPPEHTQFRRLVQKAFTARAVAAMRPRIETLANDLIDSFAERGAADLHKEIAYPLPTSVISWMLGVPEADHAVFKRWSDACVAGFGGSDSEHFRSERRELTRYLKEQVRSRRDTSDNHRASGGLMSDLAQAQYEGRSLTESEFVATVILLLIGGNETTTSLITNSIVRLIEHPDRWQRLRSSPELVGTVIEESLRYDPPVLGLFRTTTQDVTFQEMTIPRDAKTMLLFAAANRDPQLFEQPDDFSLDRDEDDLRHKHLSFGQGVHFCLGASLARLEAKVVLSQLSHRLPNLRLTDLPQRIHPFFLWGKSTLPVAWDVDDS